MKPVRAEINRVQANLGASLVAQLVKNLPAMQETLVQFLGHSSTLAWKTSWTEKPGGLQSMELRRVGYD